MQVSTKQNLTLVYMVAGLSSRFGGRAKALTKVGPSGETLLEYSLNQALKSGFSKIVLIVGEKTEKLFKDYFGNEYKKIPIKYAKQTFDENSRDKPWGTCDAVVCAKEFLTEPFVVCNGDDLYGETSFELLAKWLRENNSPSTLGFELGKTTPKIGSVNRAIYSYDKNFNVLKLKETIGIERNKFDEMNLTEKTLCSMNIFGLIPSTVILLEIQLKQFKESNKADRKKECYLPTELSNLINQKRINLKLLLTPDKWLGVTNPEDEETVRTQLALNK